MGRKGNEFVKYLEENAQEELTEWTWEYEEEKNQERSTHYE